MFSTNQHTLFFIILTLLTVPARTVSAAPIHPDEEQTGTLVGTVTDRETGDPISFAYLYLEEASRTITAHSDGHFEFDNIPAGDYSLRITRIGYQTVTQTVTIPPNDTTEVQIGLQSTPLSSDMVEVVATSGKGGASLEHASTTVSGTELRQELGTTLAATLDRQPGFSSRSMGAAPSRPVIRGLSGDRVLILQDGERTGDVSSTAADHAVTADPMTADKIEIARGPAALIYGSNAIGGVINMVRNQIATSMPDHLHGSSTLQAASVNRSGNAAVEAQLPVGPFAVQANLNYRTAGDTHTPEGVLDNSSLSSTDDALGLSYVRPWGYAGASTSLYINNYGIPASPNGGHTEGVNIEIEKYQFNGETEVYLPHTLFQSISGNISYTYYDHKEIEASGHVGTEMGLLTTNASVKAHHSDLGHLTEGTMGLWAETKDYAVQGANTPASNTYSYSAFVVEEGNVDDLHLEAGLRYDYSRSVPEEEKPNSSIGHIRSRTFHALASSVSAIYHFGQHYYVGGTFMYSFRPPSQEELFSEGPHVAVYSFEIGNPDLDAERGLGKEIFFRYRGNAISAELTGYHNSFNNYIFPENTGNRSTHYPDLNIYQYRGADSRIYGAEASAEVKLMRRLAFKGTLSYTRGERDLSATEKNNIPDDISTVPLPMIPPLKASLGLNYEYNGFRFGGRLQLAGRQDRTAEFETPTASHALVDLTGHYQFETGTVLHTLSLNAENIFNTTYRNHLSRIKEFMPEPGRNISLLYRVYF